MSANQKTATGEAAAYAASPPAKVIEHADEFRFDIIQSVNDFAQLRTQWCALESTADTPVFFQSHTWIDEVLQTRSQGGELTEPFIVTASIGGRLVAAWPLQRFRRFGATFLDDLTAPFGQYSEVLIAQGLDQRATLKRLVAFICKSGFKIDGILVRKVRAGSNLEHLIDLGGTRQNEGNKAPWVSYASFANFDQYLASLNTKSRKNLRNFRNRLTRTGPLEQVVLRTKSDITAAMANIFNARQDWLLDQGLTSSAFRDPDFARLITRLAENQSNNDLLLVTVLKHNNKPIASQLGFVHNNRYYAYISARDTELDRSVSAGRLHLQEVLRTCFELKIKEADLLAPANPYKMTWTKLSADVFDVFLPLTPWGRFIGRNIIGGAMPTARAFYAKLPMSVRRPLADLLNRSGKNSPE